MLFIAMLTRLAANRRRRTALLQLRELDNRLLFDVGLTSCDIDAALRQPRRK